jgi:hypothetical protein
MIERVSLVSRADAAPNLGAAVSDSARRSKLQGLLGLLPMCVGLWSALPTLLNGALYDDELLIFSNPFAQRLSYLGANLTRDFFYSAAGRDIGYYRPGTKLAFMLEYQAFGGRPFGYHALSLVLFLITIAIAQRLAVRLGLPRWAASLGSCLFASQPLTARSVATIASQADLLMAAGVLGSLIAWRNYQERRAALWLWTALLLEAAAISCKETALVTPLLLWLCAAPPVERTPRVVRLREALALLAPAGLYLMLRAWFGVLPLPGEASSTGVLIASAGKLTLEAAARCLAPLAYLPLLHSDRPSGALGSVLLWLVPGLALAIASLLAYRRWPWLRAALALFWLPLLPILLGGSRVHVSEDPGALVLSDRWLLLSALGASYLCAALLERALHGVERAPLRKLIGIACAALVVTQSLVCAEENASYQSENTRVQHLARLYREHDSYPRDAEEVLLAADALTANERGDAAASLRAHQRLLELNPGDSMRHYNVAQAVLALDRPREALAEAYLARYGRSLDGKQQLPDNDSLSRHRAEKALLLGLCYERLGELEAARAQYRDALAANPALTAARAHLGAQR